MGPAPSPIRKSLIAAALAATLALSTNQPASAQYSPSPYYGQPPASPPNNAFQNNRIQLNNRYRQLLESARRLIGEGRPQNALPVLAEAAAINSRDPEVHFWRGLALDKLSDYKDAVKSYAHCLTLAKTAGMDSSELRINLGNTLVKLNYLNEALFDYQRRSEITPTSGLPRLYLRLFDQTDYNLALDEFRKMRIAQVMVLVYRFQKSCLHGSEGGWPDAGKKLRPASYTSFQN
ncbi:MAG: tetratricopeptide repeat protein [Cyanobacteriota/Melainabacteria group bacterium]